MDEKMKKLEKVLIELFPTQPHFSVVLQEKQEKITADILSNLDAARQIDLLIFLLKQMKL